VSDAVTLYVEGVVQREAGRVRVDARMVNAADGFMVWAQSYEDTITGGRFMGCMNKVFGGEINVDLFLLAEAGRGSYGGIKMTGEPLPQCQFTVERAYEGEGPEYECVNRTFFDMTHQHPESINAFDLRNTLT